MTVSQEAMGHHRPSWSPSWPPVTIAYCLSLFVRVITNGFLTYAIVMPAHLSDYKLAVGVDHIIYGWLFFGIVIWP